MAEFSILLDGMFKEEDIKLTRKEEFIEDPRWLAEKIIDPEWEKLIKLKRDSGEAEPSNGQLSRLIGYEIEDGKVHFELGNMWYKQYIGYRAIASAFIEHFGLQSLPMRIGNTSVVILKEPDEKESFLMVRRTRDVADYPYWLGAGAAGGMPVTVNSMFDSMRSELNKEWGIRPTDIEQMFMTGYIVDGLNKNNSETTFVTKVNLSHKDLEAIPYAEERWENERQAREEGKKQYGIYLSHNPVEISNFILTHDSKITPTSQATIVLYGKKNPFGVQGFGQSWYKSVMDNLREKWLEKSHKFSIIEREHAELVNGKYGLR